MVPLTIDMIFGVKEVNAIPMQGGVGRSEAKYESQMRRIAQIFRIMRILRWIKWNLFPQISKNNRFWQQLKAHLSFSEQGKDLPYGDVARSDQFPEAANLVVWVVVVVVVSVVVTMVVMVVSPTQPQQVEVVAQVLGALTVLAVSQTHSQL